MNLLVLVCIAGFFMNNVTSICVVCAIGSWSGGGLITECTSCGGNMITATEGANNQEQCGIKT